MKAALIGSVALLASLLSQIDDVAAFAISPVRLSLDASGGIEVIRLRNNQDVKREVMLKAFAWSNSDDPADLEPTDDLLVVPPIFEVQPNSEQVVRVAVRNPLALDQEKPYRLLISEVPSEVAQSPGLNFALELNLPIFVVPRGAEAVPQWSIAEGDGQDPVLVLKNDGNAHMKLLSVDLTSADSSADTITADIGGYIFGGEEKRWPVTADIARLKGPVTLKAETTKGSIESIVSLPDG